MMLFMESGGQYHQNNILGPGIWQAAAGNVSIQNNAPAGRASTWAYNQNINGGSTSPPPFGQKTTLIAGMAIRTGPSFGAAPVMAFQLAGVNQCELRTNASDQLYFTRNGTNLGAGNPTASTNVLPTSTWLYIEMKCIFATGATGTCEVRVNGAVWLTLTNVQNANTTAAADLWYWWATNGGNVYTYCRDFYVLDATTGFNNSYLGDITVAEVYPVAPGTNSAWAQQPAASFTLTSVANASAGTTAYTGTITGGATNTYQGYYFTVAGFTNSVNNGTFLCSASTATTITLVNASGAAETHAATVAFQNNAQIGIQGGEIIAGTANVGTRPNGDVAYYVDSTPGDLSDWQHQSASIPGNILCVNHLSCVRKDDAGSRTYAPITVQGGSVVETGVTQGAASSYLYTADYLPSDPGTGVAWTQSGFNNSSFGIKEVA